MSLRFLQHKVLGHAPFTIIHGMIPRVPLPIYTNILSEWEDIEFSVESVIATT